ncbi:hypothetical protein COO60DRAFT_989478 [Scenedesmus sp. NREL 46B-D3]|nr:hypothetical protein COO60DRAFT_989478 [Scenedesmus sp. NREL 46B-D3]
MPRAPPPPCQVTYFYRWPDLADAVEGSAANTRRLARALTGLGVTQHARELDALLRRRGCGHTPPNHFGMRYVVFSNHETKDPGPEPGSDDEEEHEEDEAEDSPVPMESVMGPAQVLFLPSSAKLPYQPAPPPAASAAGETARKAAALPQALQTRLALRRQQLAPGFICNLFLAKAEGASQQPRLFGLSEWADGSAGAALRGRPWVAGSRRQVQQLLADSQEHLRAAAPQQAGSSSRLAHLAQQRRSERQGHGQQQQQQQRQATGTTGSSLLMHAAARSIAAGRSRGSMTWRWQAAAGSGGGGGSASLLLGVLLQQSLAGLLQLLAESSSSRSAGASWGWTARMRRLRRNSSRRKRARIRPHQQHCWQQSSKKKRRRRRGRKQMMTVKMRVKMMKRSRTTVKLCRGLPKWSNCRQEQ